MNGFIAQYLNHPVIWAAVVAVLAFIAILSVQKLSEQPFFGGRRHKATLVEHYLHGEMTTQEYENRKCGRQVT